MRKSKRKVSIEPTIGHRVVKQYIDRNGVECIDVEYTDGKRMTFKIYNPKDPFWKKCKEEFADIPSIDWDAAVSELRD